MNKEIYNYAIFLLSKQDYSKPKILRKLSQKYPSLREDFPPVVDALENRGYIRTEIYKKNLIKKWLLKGEAESKIKLRAKAEDLELNSADFEVAKLELNLSPEANIETLIQKKLRSRVIPEDFSEKRKLKDKLIRFLISKGYSFDTCISAINKHF